MPITLSCFRAFFASSPIPNRSIRVDANFFRGGRPRNADSQASDADGIGIYPVHTRWTIVDGGDARAGVCAVGATPLPPPPGVFRYFNGHRSVTAADERAV